MDMANFRIWWQAHREAFPSLEEWLSGTTDPQATLRAWQGVFEAKRVQLVDAMAVTRAMLAGDIEPPAAYERETTPAFVAKHARELAYRRKHRTETVPLSEQELVARRSCEPLARIYREAADAHQAGGDVAAVLRRYFADGPDLDDRRVRYACLMCSDTGYVDCVGALSTSELDRVADGGPLRRMVGRCQCRKGASLVGDIGNFDPLQHVRVRPTREATRAGCAELADDIRRREAEAKKNPFESWNNRE